MPGDCASRHDLTVAHDARIDLLFTMSDNTRASIEIEARELLFS
jgi:hypothetical protein